MKKQCILSAAFLVSLLPMLLNQYGGMKGVQEITGMINLLTPNAFPIGIIAVVLFFVGVWAPFEKKSTGKVLGVLGVIGIVAAEIYTFFTWHVLTITGEVSMQHSLEFAFPEFYLGLAVSLLMVVAYFVIDRKIEN
ncbi:MAG: hypothetical protein J6C83_00725 [Peptococcaceae bacterium]|nr:hypothetical protein [Peptococcaceae bacterium]